jgi:hypothetical protein
MSDGGMALGQAARRIVAVARSSAVLCGIRVGVLRDCATSVSTIESIIAMPDLCSHWCIYRRS